MAPRSALGGERKQITVLYADLKGLDVLAKRDPEDARANLEPVQERMMKEVHRYERTVKQVRRDAIMAPFGSCNAALVMLRMKVRL